MFMNVVFFTSNEKKSKKHKVPFKIKELVATSGITGSGIIFKKIS